jgi:hypothetical protein
MPAFISSLPHSNERRSRGALDRQIICSVNHRIILNMSVVYDSIRLMRHFAVAIAAVSNRVRTDCHIGSTIIASLRRDETGARYRAAPAQVPVFE